MSSNSTVFAQLQRLEQQLGVWLREAVAAAQPQPMRLPVALLIIEAAIILTVFIWAEVRHRRQLREEARRPRAALVLGLLPETAHIGETLRFKLAPPGAFWPPVAPNAWVRVGPFLSLTDISRPVFPGLSAEAKQDVTLDPPEEVNGGSGSSGGLFSDDEEDTGADGTALRRSTRRRAAVSRRSGHSPVRTSARRKSGSAVDKNAVDSGADHANPWVVRIVHLDSDLLLHPKVTPVTDPLPGSMEVVFTPPRRGLYEVQAWHSGVLVRYLPALVTVT